MINLVIKNKRTNKEIPIQRFYIDSGISRTGHLECSDMVHNPEDKEYIILPFNIEIKLNERFEPKKPEFKVIAPLG